MRVLEEGAEIPTYKFENALIRKNRRYYNSTESNFISLFSSDFNDDYPDPFVRLDILWWLQSMNKKMGPTKEKGVFPVSDLVRNLQMFGHSSNNTFPIRRTIQNSEIATIMCRNSLHSSTVP